MVNDIWRTRQAVTAAYPGPVWVAKVAKMSDSQVVAVYMRLKLNGKVS